MAREKSDLVVPEDFPDFPREDDQELMYSERT